MNIRPILLFSCLVAAAPVQAGWMPVQESDEAASCELKSLNMIVSPQVEGAGFPEEPTHCHLAEEDVNLREREESGIVTERVKSLANLAGANQ